MVELFTTMTYKIRFSLIGLGIIIFLVTTPLLVLYARGFTFDWHTRLIIKTGAIVFKTEPAKALIFLNGKQQKNFTPSNIRFLIPADYDLRLEKDGYQTWIKRLAVRAQYVTWANFNRDFVTLFLQTARLEQSWNSTKTSISKSGNELIFLDANLQATSIDTSTGNVTRLESAGEIILPQILGSIKTNWQNAAQVFQLLQSKNKWGLTDKQIAQIQQAETNGAHTVIKLDSDLYSLDTSIPGLLDQDILTFALEDDSLWYIQANFLKLYNYSTGNTETISQNVPNATSGQIIRSDKQVCLILDGKLYILNDTFEKIYDDVTTASWDPVSKLLLFANNNEILIYNPGNQNTELILRSSSPLKNPRLNFETGYVFLTNEGKIKAVELDGRDHRNTYTILNQPDPNSSFVFSPDGKTLYTIIDTKIDRYTIR